MAKKRKPQKLRNQSIQVSMKVTKPRGVELSPQLLNEAYNAYIETGESPQGFEITGIIWHKEFLDGRTKDYEYTDQENFPDVLRVARNIGLKPKVFSRVSGE